MIVRCIYLHVHDVIFGEIIMHFFVESIAIRDTRIHEYYIAATIAV